MSALAYDLRAAAVVAGMSVETLRKAIKASDGPHLKAKRNGNKYVIKAADLEAFIDALPDA